jgi:single-stranded-DNA-specific exonuclease
MLQRGLDSFEKAKAYFCPSLGLLHDPFLMRGMEEAVERLHQALRRNESILVYGDYDVDGTSSVALMVGYLRQFSGHVHYYLPDREKEGYGMSEKGIAYAAQVGCSVIVALDCGIKAVQIIAQAREAGIDVIVCDHHQPGPELPPALAILNPKQQGCSYPFKDLCGCGIGFKLIQGLEGGAGEWLQPWLDLVAVATAADIVPMTGENRILVYYGLEQLNHAPRPGLQALIEIAGQSKPLEVSDIVFRIGPRINAAGRMAHAEFAVRLLLEEELEKAKGYAREINQNNSLRQDYDRQTTDQALEMMATYSGEAPFANVLYHPEWHKGVIGIVASRLIDQHYRPTILLTRKNEEVAVGSARSVEGFNLYQALAACRDWLLQFGGHPMAAGLQLPIDYIEGFREAFEAQVRRQITPEQREPTLEYDLWLSIEEIDEKFFNSLQRFGPFGPESQRPVFISTGVMPGVSFRVLREKHLRFSIAQPQQGQALQAIGFNMAPAYTEMLRARKPLDVCYTIEENHYRQQRQLQLRLKDMRLSEHSEPS